MIARLGRSTISGRWYAATVKRAAGNVVTEESFHTSVARRHQPVPGFGGGGTQRGRRCSFRRRTHEAIWVALVAYYGPPDEPGGSGPLLGDGRTDLRGGCFALLILLGSVQVLLGILLYPLMEDTSAERALFGVIGLLVLGAALYVVKRGPWLTGFAVVLALPVVVLSIWLAFDFDPRRMLIMAALEAMFYFYAAGSLIAYMLEDEFATIDELFAAGATFTLLAWAFAYVYVVCQALLPGSFGARGADDPRTWMELLFLSFTTLSGVGLGDIIPLLPMARALVMIEQFAGVMYLALVVSRLVALSVIMRRDGEKR